VFYTSCKPEIVLSVLQLCCWNVIRKAIKRNLEVRNLEYLSILKQLSLPCLATSVLYVEKKIGIGCVNIRKNSSIRHISKSFSYDMPRTLETKAISRSWFVQNT
jgi:hypothetical protein